MHRTLRHRTASLFALIASLVLLSQCVDSPTAGVEPEVPTALSLAPALAAPAAAALEASLVTIDRVRVVLKRANGTVLTDTTLVFPPGVDVVTLVVEVPVVGSSEVFSAEMQLKSGNDVLFSGTRQIQVTAGGREVPDVSVPVQYVGRGARAARVTISPRTLQLKAGEERTLTAAVVDSSGQAIADVPLVWSTSDPAIVAVTGAGSVKAGAQRGSASIAVRLLSGLGDQIPLSVILPPANLRVIGGGGSGTVGSTLAQPLVVEVDAADGVPVADVPVTFASLDEGATVSPASAVTDAQGRASATLKLGNRSGTQTFTASAQGLATVSVSATATAGTPSRILSRFNDVRTDTIGRTLPLAVQVTDAFGNVSVGATVGWARVSGTGRLAAATSATDAAGNATVDYTLGNQPGSESVRAFLANGAEVTLSMVAVSRPATAIVATSVAAQTGAVGSAGVPLGVRVTDATGARAANVAVTWTVTGASTVGSPTTQTDAVGETTVPVTLAAAPGVSTIVARIPSGASVSFTVTAISVTPTTILANTPTAITAPVGTTASPVPQVLLKDALGNPVAGASVSFTASAGNGTVVGGSVVSNASGLASPTSWTFATAVGKDTLVATAAALPGSPIKFIATTVAGPATQLVIVSGDAQTATTGTPLAAPLVVEARDAYANPVASVNVTFTATVGGGTPSPTVLTTNVLGRASHSFTVGTVGAQTVQACLASCVANVSFSALAVPVGADATWVGGLGTQWSTAGNWSPAVVPGAASNVFIPTGTANSPALTAGASVNDLTLASGATLALGGNQLTVGGDLAAGTTITGGTVVMTGTAVDLSGSIPSLSLGSSASVTPLGTVVISGALSLANGATFDVASSTTTVTGDLDVASGARLLMTNGVGQMTVNGNAVFHAHDMGDGELTAGTLILKGDLTATGGSGQSFRATGTHTTRFAGSASQSVAFEYPTDNYSRFQNLEITNTIGTVTFASVAVARGAANVAAGATVGGSILYVAGQLTSAATSSLSGLSAVNVYGTGAVFPVILGTAPGGVVLQSGGLVSPPAGSTTLPTHLSLVNGTTLDLGARNVLVTGNLDVGSSSTLLMQDGSGQLTVNGNAVFHAHDMGDGELTAGLLILKGNLTATGGSGQAFRATGSHVTRFAGTGPQSVSFEYPADNYSRFQNLEIANTVSTVSFGTIAVTRGTMNLAASTTVAGSTLYVAGQLTSAATSSLSAVSAVNVYGVGAVFPVILGAAPGGVVLQSGGLVSPPAGATTLPTNLSLVNGTTLDIAAKTVLVTGNLDVGSSSTLLMQDGSGQLTVNGNAVFHAHDMGDGELTAGLLILKGNLTATGGSGQAFRATGSHVTRFAGTGPQSVSFEYPADNYSRFQNLEIANTVSTVSFGTIAVTRGTMNLAASTTVAGSTLYVAGQLTSAATSSLSAVSAINVYGVGAVFPVILGAAPSSVVLQSGGIVTPPAGSTTLPTNLSLVNGTTLDLGARTVIVTGGLDVASSSRLLMTDGAGQLTVNGNAVFHAHDMGDGELTAGLLILKGNLVATGGSGQAFRATGSHTTRFAGTGAQSVSFEYPTDNYSRFQNLEITNTGGTVTLASNAVARGSASLAAGTTVAGSVTLYLGGQLTSAAGSSLSGLGALAVYAAGANFPVILGAAPGIVIFQSGGSTTLPTGSTTLGTNLRIESGTTLDLGSNAVLITGSLDVASGAHLLMQSSAAQMTVQGSALFHARDMGDTELTAGTLILEGNFTATGGLGQAFRATGTHLTRFAGSGLQTISFEYSGGGQSQFQNLEVTNASASGVSLGSGLQTGADFTQLGKFTVTSQTLNIAGVLRLGPSSTTSVTGVVNRGSCVILPGAPGPVYSGFTCP